MKKILSILAILIWMSCSMAYAKVESFEPAFVTFSQNAIQRKKWNRLYPLGQAKFDNQVQVPIYGVTVQHPNLDGELKESKPCSKDGCSFNFKLEPQDATQLKILVIPGTGAVLVPRDWTDIEASKGGNGSGFALIMSPNQKQAIRLYDSSLCVGCGMPYASLYFPQLLKQSIENEFGGYQDRHKKLTLVHPSKNVAFFSYQIANFNNKTHGIAKYVDGDFFNFQEIHVTLDKSQQGLAKPILNFYNATH